MRRLSTFEYDDAGSPERFKHAVCMERQIAGGVPDSAARWVDSVLRSAWVSAVCAAFADLMWVLMPSDCVVCGARDAVLCSACTKNLHRSTLKPFRAEEAAEALPLDLETNVVLPVVAAGLYKDGVSATVLAFKNHQRFTLKKELGRSLARAVRTALEELDVGSQRTSSPVWVVPIPASPASLRKRGYWPVGELLKVASKSMSHSGGLNVRSILRVTSAAQSSHRGASARERRSRRGTMTLAPGLTVLKGQRVLLVDDVLTTGATLAQAHQVLRTAGFEVIGAAVLAATQNPR